MANTTIPAAEEAQICAEFRQIGFDAHVLTPAARTAPGEWLLLVTPGNQDLIVDVLRDDILRPGVATLEISRTEPGRIYLRNIPR